MRKRKPDKLPTFKSYEEAGEFWDTHSLADYWHITEPVKFDIKLKERPRMVEVDHKIYAELSRLARKKRSTISKLASRLIAERIAEIHIFRSGISKGKKPTLYQVRDYLKRRNLSEKWRIRESGKQEFKAKPDSIVLSRKLYAELDWLAKCNLTTVTELVNEFLERKIASR